MQDIIDTRVRTCQHKKKINKRSKKCIVRTDSGFIVTNYSDDKISSGKNNVVEFSNEDLEYTENGYVIMGISIFIY